MTLRLVRQKKTQTPPQPDIEVQFSPKVTEPVQKSIERAVAASKFYKTGLEVDKSFVPLAIAIYEAYGADSHVWEMLHILNPTLIPRNVWKLYEDGVLTMEEVSNALNGGQWVYWELDATIHDALLSGVHKALRKSISRARKDKVQSKTKFQGIEVHIDRPKGFIQEGISSSGEAWTRVYACDYGFIPGTLSGDGEAFDVYLGEVADATMAYIVEQVKEDGEWDEFKLMLGFNSTQEAKDCYFAHTPMWAFGNIYAIPVQAVKDFVTRAETKEKGVSLLKPKTRKSVTFHPTKKAAPAPTEAGGVPERFVLGEVLIPETVDLQGEIYDEKVIRDTAHNWMANYRRIGFQHMEVIVYGDETEESGARASIVESYLAPIDMEVEGRLIKKGTWILGTIIHDDLLWQDILDGKLTGYSMGGFSSDE